MLRILLIDDARRARHYAHLRAHYEADWLVSADWKRQVSSGQVDLALVSDEFKLGTSLAIRELQRIGVPVLHIADGIVEWRNCWENPRSLSPRLGLPLYQPVLADKLACLGRSQARLIESWGNLGRCEVIGAPRLDPLLGCRARGREPRTPFRILVATAQTPGFTDSQVRYVRRALDDILSLDGRVIAGERVDLCWRVTPDPDHLLGSFVERSLLSDDLPAVLANVDAVLTTPSTLMLEAMVVGLPVALIDYGNSPHYVPAAWTVSAPEHLDTVLSELIRPPAAKILYQNTILHDALECRTPATPRMVALMEHMASIGRRCRTSGVQLAFPTRLVPLDGMEHHLPEKGFDLRALYPGHPVFGQQDVVALQVEVSHLRMALDRARRRLLYLRAAGVSMMTLRQRLTHYSRRLLTWWRGRAVLDRMPAQRLQHDPPKHEPPDAIADFVSRCRAVAVAWPINRFIVSTDLELSDVGRSKVRNIRDWRGLLPVYIRRFGWNDTLEHVYCFGAAHGDTVTQLVAAFRDHGLDLPHLNLFDSFDGLPDEVPGVPVPSVWTKGAFKRSVSSLRERLHGAGLDESQYSLFEGWFKDTLVDGFAAHAAFRPALYVDIDADLYGSAKEALTFMFTQRLIQPGTFIGYDDWGDTEPWVAGESRAHKEVLSEFGVRCVQMFSWGEPPVVRKLFLIQEIGR